MTADPTRLDSWKQIASYLGKSERTVRRWQETEGLPVHRHLHQQRGSVWAYQNELDEWLATRRLSPEPLVEVPAVPEGPEIPEVRSRTREVLPWALGVAAVLLAAAVVWRHPPRRAEPVQLTSLSGTEYSPAFSPDGKRIAYFWSDHPRTPTGIYVRALDGETHTHLVGQEPGRVFVYNPAWSRDGGTLAFLRRYRQAETWLFLTGGEGGPERKLAQLSGGVTFGANHHHIAWGRSGEWLVAPAAFGADRGLRRIAVANGEMTPVTRTADLDLAPALSPDGRWLAFLRQSGPQPSAVQTIFRMPMGDDGRPTGPPEALYRGRSMASGIAWLPDGRELVFCNSEVSYIGPFRSRPYRMAARPGATPEAIAPNHCMGIAVSPPDSTGAVTLVFASSADYRGRMYVSPSDDPGTSRALAPSSKFDGLPDVSPDGATVAFLSTRSGDPEVFVARLDTGEARRITNGARAHSTPRFSPDGGRLLYAAGEVSPAVYTVPVTGGGPRAIPTPGQDALEPFWSHDGREIFYTVGSQLWRMRADGQGRAKVHDCVNHSMHLTSPDGRDLWFTRQAGAFELVRVPMGGGPETVVAEGLRSRGFAMTRDAVYAALFNMEIVRIPLEGGPPRSLGFLQLPPGGGRPLLTGGAVSPDGKTLVWSVGNEPETDLYAIRGFR